MERKTILLVDDNPANLKLLVSCIEGRGFKVAVARNGEEALRRLQLPHLAKPDLILLDIMMPGVDGYETCHQIKQNPDLKDIPVIFLSARSETSDMVHGFSVGAVDYITKPINFAEVIARVNTHLELAELRNELDLRVRRKTQELIDANALLRHEIAERKKVEEQIRYIATHDALTDLPNRLLLKECLERLIAQAKRHNRKVGLMLLDLDQFKMVNDSLGHSVGDMLLNDVAYRLQKNIQPEDLVARLGGDEFVVCIPIHHENDEIDRIARKLSNSLHDPFNINEYNLHVSASIGIAIYPDDGADTDTLMRNADTAMYYAKQSGRAEIKRFTSDLNTYVQGHLNLSSLLIDAIKNCELFMEYQPLIDLDTGDIIGAEALMRWRRADGTLVSPAEFIPVAESSGLIKELGEFGVRQSCAELKRWHNAGYDHLSIAINISVQHLKSSGFVDAIRKTINEFELPPHKIELEITESLLMQHSKANLSILNNLSEFGVRLSVDDFGTGYSSLAYLRDFPVNMLKIDISFVRNIGLADGYAIPSVIIAMAHSLHLKVVAEGVELSTQQDFLKSQGCDFTQGFYYSRSVSGDEFLNMCRTRLSPADGSHSRDPW